LNITSKIINGLINKSKVLAQFVSGPRRLSWIPDRGPGQALIRGSPGWQSVGLSPIVIPAKALRQTQGHEPCRMAGIQNFLSRN